MEPPITVEPTVGEHKQPDGEQLYAVRPHDRVLSSAAAYRIGGDYQVGMYRILLFRVLCFCL
jgi:hypothetical protein